MLHHTKKRDNHEALHLLGEGSIVVILCIPRQVASLVQKNYDWSIFTIQRLHREHYTL
jgi:hypothetical protein